MSSPAATRHRGPWPFTELEDLVDEFLADPDGLEDVAELEHAALVLRAPFDALGAPAAVSADLALALERRDDELAAGMLTALGGWRLRARAYERRSAARPPIEWSPRSCSIASTQQPTTWPPTMSPSTARLSCGCRRSRTR